MSLCVLAPLRETFRVAAVLSVAFATGVAHADEAAVATVLKSLHRPCGVAVRPGGTADRYEVFLAESGSGRVVRWSSHTPNRAADMVTGFASQAAADPFHQTGPVSLWFLDPGLLVVGTTQNADGDLVRAYELPDGESALSAEVARESTKNENKLDGATCSAIGRSRANEYVPDTLALVVRGTDGRTRLLKARVQAGILGDPHPFGPADSASSPRAVATSDSGRIVVADAGGRLTFYNPINGTVELAMPIDLKEVTGLAYSPTSDSLYAVDFAGGIHRIDDASQPGRPACKTVKVADVDQPTALAFAPDGALYVVTYGDGDDNGTLQVITGDL